MRILFFTKGDKTTSSSRWRVWFLAKRMKSAYGYDYDVIHGIRHSVWLPSLKRLQALKKIRLALSDTRYAIVHIHKSLYPWDVIFLILFAKWRWHKQLIYDLDDAEWIHSPRKTQALARAADTIIAGSHRIFEHIKQYNNSVILIPSVIDYDAYQRYRVTHAQSSPLTIGWIGMGKGHFLDGHFAMVRPALDQLAARGISFRFVIIGSQNYQPLKDYFADASFPVIYIDQLDWANPESIPQTIQQYEFAVGLAPISNTSFNKAKCAGKSIEYMACGVPVVASPTGENAKVIEHGETGFLATTTEEWLFAIETLLHDSALRKTLGEAGMRRVRDYYSYKAVLPRYHAIFQSL